MYLILETELQVINFSKHPHIFGRISSHNFTSHNQTMLSFNTAIYVTGNPCNGCSETSDFRRLVSLCAISVKTVKKVHDGKKDN